jgi:hypothetical protein
MPLEEKYDKLVDSYVMTSAANYALIKELGVEEKYIDIYGKVFQSMLPSFLGTAFKFMKAIAPGRSFRQVTDQHAYTMQSIIPSSNIELTRISDREATLRIKDCPVRKRLGDIFKKTDLDIDPRYGCELDAKIMPEALKDFGIEMIIEIEENGCIMKGKLK